MAPGSVDGGGHPNKLTGAREPAEGKRARTEAAPEWSMQLSRNMATGGDAGPILLYHGRGRVQHWEIG